MRVNSCIVLRTCGPLYQHTRQHLKTSRFCPLVLCQTKGRWQTSVREAEGRYMWGGNSTKIRATKKSHHNTLQFSATHTLRDILPRIPKAVTLRHTATLQHKFVIINLYQFTATNPVEQQEVWDYHRGVGTKTPQRQNDSNWRLQQCPSR